MNWMAALLPYFSVWIGLYILHSGWCALLLYHVGIIAFLIARRRRGVWQKIGRGAFGPILVPGVLACALAAPILYFMWPLFAVESPLLSDWLASYGLTGWAWGLLIPYFSVVHPLLEELHWREIAPERVRALCAQDLLFAGYHVLVLFQLVRAPWLVLVFAVLAASSFFWRWCAARFEGYAIPMATHAVADAAVLGGVIWLLNS